MCKIASDKHQTLQEKFQQYSGVSSEQLSSMYDALADKITLAEQNKGQLRTKVICSAPK